MNMKSIVMLVLAILLFSCASKIVVQKPIIIEKPIVQKELVEVVTSEKKDGKKIFENNCANCHRLYAPDEYSKQEWTFILKRMKLKADLNDEEIVAVQEFIFKDLK